MLKIVAYGNFTIVIFKVLSDLIQGIVELQSLNFCVFKVVFDFRNTYTWFFLGVRCLKKLSFLFKSFFVKDFWVNMLKLLTKIYIIVYTFVVFIFILFIWADRFTIKSWIHFDTLFYLAWLLNWLIRWF